MKHCFSPSTSGRLLVWMLLVMMLLATGQTVMARTQDSDELNQARELYEEARAALHDDNYRRAASRFGRVYEQYEDSQYAADALYWQAFSLYRMDRTKYLRRALDALVIRDDEYPDAGMQEEAMDLLTRVRGELAKRGDADAAERVTRDAEQNELKMATLQALMNMNSDRAIPLLKRVLEKRDRESVELRCQAVFLLAEHGDSDEVAKLLLDVYRNDPSTEVRQNAIFWLSEVPGDETLDILEEIVRNEEEIDLRSNALFALQEHHSSRADEIMQDIARDRDQPEEIRESAIFWIGQDGDSENVEFLMELYEELDDDLKENVLFSISESDHRLAADWLMQIVKDEDEEMDLRNNALFWLGENHHLPIDEIMDFYVGTDDEMKEQVIFLLSQRDSKEALRQLIHIVRTERDSDLRSKAVFWIGQYDDPEAEDILLEIIEE